MTAVGITGTRRLNDRGRAHIVAALVTLDPATDRLIVGGCVGADAFAGQVGLSLGLDVHVILPHDRSQVDPDWRQYATSWQEGGVYRERNEKIVAQCDGLWAFPALPEPLDNPRSGTWMTVRIARRARKLALLKPQHTGPERDSDLSARPTR